MRKKRSRWQTCRSYRVSSIHRWPDNFCCKHQPHTQQPTSDQFVVYGGYIGDGTPTYLGCMFAVDTKLLMRVFRLATVRQLPTHEYVRVRNFRASLRQQYPVWMRRKTKRAVESSPTTTKTRPLHASEV